jgi:hypothetical protein
MTAREQSEAMIGAMDVEADEPTDEEREAIEEAWMRGDELPSGWVVVELPEGLAPNGVLIPPGTAVMLRTRTFEAYLAANRATAGLIDS